MTSDYGRQIMIALNAVRQLHSDTSRLLVDFGKKMGADWYSVFGNFATRELTYSVNTEFWMAEGVYRYWASNNCPGVVKGLTICFFDRRIQEPILVVAEVKYHLQLGTEIRSVCKEWDLRNLFLDWNEKRVTGDVITFGAADGGRIQSATLIAKPIYDIGSVD